MSGRKEPSLIIIGGGVGAIALGIKLKKDYNYHNFTIFEREKEIGGTWYLNTYPGVGCDVPCHFYSFSFNLNPDWSRIFADQEEIEEYVKSTTKKFGLDPHFQMQVEVIGAQWMGSFWRVQLKNLVTNVEFYRDAEMLVSAVGVFNTPKDVDIPGVEKYQGKIIHTGRWDNSYDVTGKSVAVVGNGCSAAQLVSAIAPKVKSLTQFQRTAQWIYERNNRNYTKLEKFVFRNVPLVDRIYRYNLFRESDALHSLYMTGSESTRQARLKVQRDCEKYMLERTPKKYHDIILPDFELGCKRRIFDPGYLDALHNPAVELTTEKIVEFTPDGLLTSEGSYQFDAVLLATGYKVQEFLQPLHVVGKNGISLNQHWKETNGAQAYCGSFISGFPNFGIIFGPNSFPAHNSVIFSNEVTAEYIIKTMINPIVKNHFDQIEVKDSSESYDANSTQEKLKDMVWKSSCRSWNISASGRNTTSYHDFAYKMWYNLYWPVWRDFITTGGKNTKPDHPAVKILKIFGLVLATLAVGRYCAPKATSTIARILAPVFARA